MIDEKRKQEIARRAQSDAQALRSGWPVQNPYTSASESDEWQKQFDLALWRLYVKLSTANPATFWSIKVTLNNCQTTY